MPGPSSWEHCETSECGWKNAERANTWQLAKFEAAETQLFVHGGAHPDIDISILNVPETKAVNEIWMRDARNRQVAVERTRRSLACAKAVLAGNCFFYKYDQEGTSLVDLREQKPPTLEIIK